MRLGQLLRVDLRTGRKRDDRPRQPEAVAGADHRRQRLLPLPSDRAAPVLRTGRSCAAWRSAARPRRLPHRHARARSAPSASSTPAARSFCRPRAVCHSRAPVSASRLRQRIGRVVDIALLGEAVGNRFEIGLPLARPSRARGSCARGRSAASPASSQNGRHSAAQARSACSHRGAAMPGAVLAVS